MKVYGTLYDGQSSQAKVVEIVSSQNEISVYDDDDGRPINYRREDFKAEAPMPGSPLKIYLPSGARIELESGPINNAFHKSLSSGRAGLLAHLENNIVSALASMALVAIFFFFIVTKGAPLLGEIGAKMVPQDWIEFTDETLLKNLEGHYFSPSKISIENREALKRALSPINEKGHLIYFRDAPVLGANAFAIGAKTIVFTDKLVENLSIEELKAIFLHEAGHLEKRHMLSQIISTIGVNALAMMIIGDLPGFTESLANIGLTVTTLKHSRDFESEADMHAAKMLKKNGLDPMLMPKALESLKALEPNKMAPDLEFLSTHPGVDTRIKKLRSLSL